MVTRGPFVLEVPGRTFRFELHQHGGPFVLGKQGRPLVMQPGAQSIFWEAYWQWERQGQQVDDDGRCIFKWETALVRITNHVGRPLLAPPAAHHAQPGLAAEKSIKTAKVTIHSTPQDAEIFADGTFVGNAPAALTLPIGKHHFRVVAKGYAEWTKGLDLIPNSEHTLAASLVKLAG